MSVADDKKERLVGWRVRKRVRYGMWRRLSSLVRRLPSFRYNCGLSAVNFRGRAGAGPPPSQSSMFSWAGLCATTSGGGCEQKFDHGRPRLLRRPKTEELTKNNKKWTAETEGRPVLCNPLAQAVFTVLLSYSTIKRNPFHVQKFTKPFYNLPEHLQHRLLQNKLIFFARTVILQMKRNRKTLATMCSIWLLRLIANITESAKRR